MKHGKLLIGGLVAAGVAVVVAVKKGLIKNPLHQVPKLHSAEEPVIQHPTVPTPTSDQ